MNKELVPQTLMNNTDQIKILRKDILKVIENGIIKYNIKDAKIFKKSLDISNEENEKLEVLCIENKIGSFIDEDKTIDEEVIEIIEEDEEDEEVELKIDEDNKKIDNKFKTPFDEDDYEEDDIEEEIKTITLNKGQQEIYDFFKGLFDTDCKIFSINGPAGTGKTTLLIEILKLFINTNPPKNFLDFDSFREFKEYKEKNPKLFEDKNTKTIALTAPTHKALEVIRQKLTEEFPNINLGEDNNEIVISTIHSFLKLKQKIIEHGPREGEIEFIPDTNPKNEAKYVDILFLDESSMNSSSMRKNINLLFKMNRIKKLVFLGDNCQLTSVDDPFGTNKVYNPLYAKQFNLTEVMRLDDPAENEILDKAKIIREEIHKLTDARLNNKYYDYNKGFKVFNELFYVQRDSYNIVIDNYKHIKVFDSFNESKFLEAYFLDNDNKSILGFSNKLGESYNELVRNWTNENWTGEYEKLLEINLMDPMDNNKYIPKIIKNDILVFQEPHMGETCPIHQNGEVVLVKEVDIKKLSLDNLTNGVILELNGIRDVNYYAVIDQDRKPFKILHSSSKKLYDDIIYNLRRNAIGAPKGKEKSEAWRTFYKFKEIFCNVKYAFSSTIHKSQGSTYYNAYIDMRELFRFANDNKKLETSFRLIYTAITRPKNNIYVLR